jgi:antirestriction protein ArdC
MTMGSTATRTTGRQDHYTRVTQKIVASLEQGMRPWMKPWDNAHAAGPITKPRRACGTQYRGINVLLLWAEATERNYSAPIWMTYKQAADRGGQVRKGETGTHVVYANRFVKSEVDGKGGEIERWIPFLKSYAVFNVEQIDGLPEIFYAKFNNRRPLEERIQHADTFLQHMGPTIRHGGDKAFYAPSQDLIQMPPFESFVDPESYYATALHEGIHSTAVKSRLDRDFGRKRWGDAGYAAEELVAEIGAALLCAELGITPDVREDHAAYIGFWLTAMKSDKRAIFQLAAHAQRAVDYLQSCQPGMADEAAVPDSEP